MNRIIVFKKYECMTVFCLLATPRMESPQQIVIHIIVLAKFKSKFGASSLKMKWSNRNSCVYIALTINALNTFILEMT